MIASLGENNKENEETCLFIFFVYSKTHYYAEFYYIESGLLKTMIICTIWGASEVCY